MNRRGLILFSAMCLVWGIPYLLIRVAVLEIAPTVLVLARTVIGSAILVPIVLARGGLKDLKGKWLPVLAFAAAEVGGPWLFLFSAEQHLSSALSALLVSCVPLIGIMIAPLFGNRERMGPLGFGGLIVGLVGVVAIVGLDFHVSDAWALVEVGLVALGYALGPAILNKWLSGTPSVSVIGVSLAACAIVYAPFAALQWPRVLPSLNVLLSVGVLGVVCTALAFLLFFSLIEEIGPIRATIITYVNPAVAAVLGILVLHETFTVGMGVGFVLVLVGSVLGTRHRRAPRAAAAEGSGAS